MKGDNIRKPIVIKISRVKRKDRGGRGERGSILKREEVRVKDEEDIRTVVKGESKIEGGVVIKVRGDEGARGGVRDIEGRDRGRDSG